MPDTPPFSAEKAAKRYVTAEEAARELDISLATLYAYVSRGLIISEQVPGGGSRQRRYRWEDVGRLKERKDVRRHPEKAAEHALFQGSPILASAITQLDEHDFYYRGQSATTLAKDGVCFEAVAMLLWFDPERLASAEEAADFFGTNPPPLDPPNGDRRRSRGSAAVDAFESFAGLLPSGEAADPKAHDLRAPSVAATGARILRLLLAALDHAGPRRGGAGTRTAAALQRLWAPNRPEAAGLIDAALVLCADHELDAAALAACVAASTGATPYAAVLAGLAAGSGPGHMGGCIQAERLVNELAGMRRLTETGVRALAAQMTERGGGVPRYGHTIYPLGDPRSQVLFELLKDACPRSALLRRVTGFSHAVEEMTGLRPRVDVALAALAAECSFPMGAATTLFCYGRVAGWVAHAIEQYETGRIIRPRARYVGKSRTGAPSPP